VIQLFSKKQNPMLVTGEVIPKRQYIKELKNSKTCVSPFGFGEVCYRDFEAISSGCLLIKPDMDHLETWPDVFLKNETYIPVKWDMSDLEEVLYKVLDSFNSYIEIINSAQNIYSNSILNPDLFIKRYRELIRSV